METNIDIDKIIYNTTWKNKNVLISGSIAVVGYLLQDVIFPNTFSNFTTNVPDFIKNLSVKNVMHVVLPYLIAELLFYINSILISHIFPKMELDMIQNITDETIESLKTSKKQINTNEFILNLKKIIESKGFYFLLVSHIVPTILVALGIIYYFMQADVKMGLFVLLIIAILGFVSFRFEQQSVVDAVNNESILNTFYDGIQDVVANIDTVITSNCKEKEIKNINAEMTNVYNLYTKSEISASETVYKLHLSSLVIAIVICGIAIKMHMDGFLDQALLVSICIMAILLMQYYNSFINKLRYVVHHFGKFYSIRDYFAEFKIMDQSEKSQLIITNGNIEFKNISLIYPDRTIFKDLNINIKGGTKVGIFGEIGSGKTSILKMILGLIPYQGKILIDNQDISQCAQYSINSQIAYIPQHPKVFNKTIYYNIGYGTGYSKSDIINFIEKMNFKEFFEIFPNGLDAQVGKEGVKLSGGQKQIIALIRSLIQNKKILLIDEPTSSLDKNTKSVILSLISEIQNKTILLVSHDMDVKSIVSDLITLK